MNWTVKFEGKLELELGIFHLIDDLWSFLDLGQGTKSDKIATPSIFHEFLPLLLLLLDIDIIMLSWLLYLYFRIFYIVVTVIVLTYWCLLIYLPACLFHPMSVSETVNLMDCGRTLSGMRFRDIERMRNARAPNQSQRTRRGDFLIHPEWRPSLPHHRLNGLSSVDIPYSQGRWWGGWSAGPGYGIIGATRGLSRSDTGQERTFIWLAQWPAIAWPSVYLSRGSSKNGEKERTLRWEYRHSEA